MKVSRICVIPLSIILIVMVFSACSEGPSKSNWGGKSKSSSSVEAIPDNPAELTQYLIKNYGRVQAAKKVNHSEFRAWLNALGSKIVEVGIKTEDLNLDQELAAIFLVNKIFHSKNNRLHEQAKQRKNFLQKDIIENHLDQCSVHFVASGKYANCYEIEHDGWSTHIPQSVLDKAVGPAAAEKLRNRARQSLSLSNIYFDEWRWPPNELTLSVSKIGLTLYSAPGFF